MCVVCDPSIIDKRGCLGAPDWIIEILPKNTSSKDRVVHPEEQTVLVFLLDEHGKFRGHRKPYARSNDISATTLPGLNIDLSAVFPKEDYE